VASQANVQIVANGAGGVYLVWDDRLLDAVFYARSQDGGTTWSTPEKIDKHAPEDEPAAAGPAMINMVVDGNEIHLTWQAQHEDSNCAQYHQWSADSGRTWQPRIVAYEDVQGCPTGGRFVLSSNDLLFLLIDTQQGVLLQAWDGERWSEPELQQPMSSFTNPETYRQVAFACRQAAVSADNRLFEFGCGTSNGQDVWVIGRSLGDLTDWSTRFEPSPVWSTPAVVFESQLTLLSPALVVDAAGLLHAFWIETDETTLTVPDTKIYHTQWNGTAWSRVVPLLNLPAQRADQFSAIVDANERLLVMWRNPELNIFFISQVDGEQVLIPPQWSTPRELLPPQTLAAHPSLLVDKVGALHVVYAVPLNEGRGIYWMKSDDGANTWSEAALVFDAAAAGWEALDEPYLAQTGNGHLHLLWARQNALQDEPLSQALSYARSEDDGQSWSEPQLIAEGRISWHHLGSVGERTVLVAWQQEESGQTRLMSRHSYDSGATWEQPLQISLGFATDAFGKPSLVMDRAYQLHLVQLTATGFGNSGLQAWLWRGNNWEIGESLDFEAQLADVTFVDSAVVTAGDTRLVIIYTGGVVQQGSVQLSSDLFFTQRVLELPPGTPTPLPIVAPAATSSPTVTPAVVPTPTSQPEIPPDTNAVDNESLIGFIESSPPSTRLAISVIPAGLIVLVIVALYLTVARRVR
jgi:hypothetical protein